MALYIGLMSGTSLDGVDAVLVEFDDTPQAKPRVHGHIHRPFAPELRQALFALNQTGADELHRAALAANAVSQAYAEAVAALRQACGPIGKQPVRALGAHGQTVRHRPGEYDGVGYTIQLINGALLAERTGVDTVCDFRSRDVAAGGQGAPLVPAVHAALFQRPGEALAILNLGGIANLTLLGADGSIRGFDCGPANALMDLWCEQHLGLAYDEDGRWARQGRIDDTLLAAMLREPYFDRQPPKSTGRDLFHGEWLKRMMGCCPGCADRPHEDIQATLAALTARTATRALLEQLPTAKQLLVCGGGAYNSHLMDLLRRYLNGIQVTTTDDAGLPALQVEATAFAWLAKAHLDRTLANSPQVTGAAGPRVLGALFPAN